MIPKKIKLPVVLALLLSLALSGCAAAAAPSSQASGAAASSSQPALESGPAESAAGGGLPEITIRTLFTKGMTGVVNQYAIANGLYEKEGIHFEQYQSVTGTGDAVAAYAAGEIDFSDGDPGTYIPAAANGVPLKLVGNMWRSKGAYWIIANNEIQSFEDLKGKEVGSAIATGGMRITVMEVLRLNGIDPRNDVQLIANGTHQAAYSTLVAGEVEATIIHQPFATIAQDEGVGHPLAKTWEYVSDYYTGCIVASTDMIENRPEDLQRMVTAYYKVHEYVKANLDDFYPWAAEYLNITEDQMKRAVESEFELWTNEAVVPRERLQKTVDMLVSFEFLRETVSSIDNVFDNTFAEKARDELGLAG